MNQEERNVLEKLLLNSWAFLVGSGSKTVFHHLTHLRIFLKLLFNIFQVSKGSLIYIRKNNGLKIEPWGTPAWRISQFVIWPLSITLWNLPLKKLVINWNKFPLTPFSFNLSKSPSWQTLSNDIYGNDIWKTSRTSMNRFQSKLEEMSWVIANSW